MSIKFKFFSSIFTFLLVFSNSAFAHGDEGYSGFMGGFMHPVAGFDHVTAMVAVGILGAFLGRPGIWVLPIVFPLVMAFGSFLGIIGVSIPSIEVGIAVSSIVLGLIIALALKMPLWIAVALVGAFAMFHGHAHGTELPNATGPVAYSVGFVISTTLLHIAGITIGALVRWPMGVIIARVVGSVIALAGVGFLTGTL